MSSERLDRQLRIDGWNQQVLDQAKIGVVGDNDMLVSLYVLAASALGVNNMVVLAPHLDSGLLSAASGVNPDLRLVHIEGFYTHPVMDDIFAGASLIVDLSQYALANKLLLEKAFKDRFPVIRAFSYERNGEVGLKVFTYMRGREWAEIHEVVSPRNLPGSHFDDGVLDIVAAGLALEETKNSLMGERVSEELIGYRRANIKGPARAGVRIGVVGAGALGNFVGLGLALSGFTDITFMDPDVVELTNLNRQVLFYDAVGSPKAVSLSARLNAHFGISSRSLVGYVRKSTDLSGYDVVFDCVDNFETRVVLSEKCRDQRKVLISGGTSVDAGQVVVFDPARSHQTPAELLGLYDIIDQRKIERYKRDRASCTYTPDPSVIMTNQIIAGLMVDSFRRILAGHEVANIFYDASSDGKF